MSKSADRLEKIAAEYHANEALPDLHIENACQRYFVQWLVDEVPPGARVLELGFGDGIITAALVQHANVTVVEGAATLVQRARELNPGLVCVHSLFEEYQPNGDERFDVVVASHVLEHVDDPVAVLSRISAWIVPTGKVVIVVPNKESLHRQLAVLMGLQSELDTLSARDRLVGHQRVYSLKLLKDAIELAGLEVLRSKGFFLKVLPNSMMVDFSPELIRALNEVSAIVPKQLLANIAVVAALRPK